MKKFICVLIKVIIIISTMAAQKVDISNPKSSLKNSIYLENLVILPSINYDRIIALDNNIGVVLKAGLSFYIKPFIVAEASLLAGSARHHFELGGGWGGDDNLGLFGRLGYRYIGTKGFMLKGGIIIVKNVPVFPAIGIGFAF